MNHTPATTTSPTLNPSITSRPMICAVTSAHVASTSMCVSATTPMPRILPNSSCLGRTADSSTSTTRDDFSRVTPLSTQPPYVCSRMNSRMFITIAAPSRPLFESAVALMLCTGGGCEVRTSVI